MKDNKSQFASIEEDMLKVWDKEKTFNKSIENRKGEELFSFYDGPPFANGLPHFGHSLVTSIKDSMLRYKTMRGYYVPRRNGWDCHGLPVEFAIEKAYGVSGKKQIMELGLEKFNAACRASIFQYKEDWELLLQRLGRWSDYENYYATVESNYTESVWWALGEINNKGLLYKGYKSTPYCPRCETPLSNFEVNEGYKDNVSDPSLFVKFKLIDEDASMLAWTTTPWSLPGNVALAVNPNEKYVYVSYNDDNNREDVIILAKSRLSILDEQDYKIVKEVSAASLIGKTYEALFEVKDVKDLPGGQNLYRIWSANFVSVDDGSGILHIAPAFGEDDLNLGESNDIPVLTTVDASGHMKANIGLREVSGKFFKSADKNIIEYLTEANRVFASETFEHTYPFCWRCETPLLYYAINSWFIKVSDVKTNLIKTASDINWTPGHIKEGRFGKWLEGARDWAISRNRYWGAPMPIWVNQEDDTDYVVISSTEQLKKLAGNDVKIDDLHRPYIDKVTFSKDGKTYKRVEEVLDCWFESGCMSFAQFHYPFENKNDFEKSFPADFITEGLDQTRLWFYVQHVVNTLLFDHSAYENVIVNGIIMAADGQKLSKRLKNYPPVDDVFDNEGADSLRLYLLSSSQATQTADYFRFNRDALRDLNRNVLGTLLNSSHFFKLYADIDGWKPPKNLTQPKSITVLDKWLIIRLNQTVEQVSLNADNYKIAHAIQPIFELIDDTSNWYVRRSRRRFWKSEDDQDKDQAYATLHYVLVVTMQLLAPWAPFISDKIYRDLTKGMTTPQSVHLTDWPKAEKYDADLLESMSVTRGIVEQGLGLRMQKDDNQKTIKVRQPLQSLTYTGDKLPPELEKIIADEVNVKDIKNKTLVKGSRQEVSIDKNITQELKLEGLMRELVRQIQSLRKKSGLKVDDRIELFIDSNDSIIRSCIDAYSTTIMAETLALKFLTEKADGYTETINIDGANVGISLVKSKAKH